MNNEDKRDHKENMKKTKSQLSKELIKKDQIIYNIVMSNHITYSTLDGLLEDGVDILDYYQKEEYYRDADGKIRLR